MCKVSVPSAPAPVVQKTVTEQDPQVQARIDQERRKMLGQNGQRSTIFSTGFTPVQQQGKTLLGA